MTQGHKTTESLTSEIFPVAETKEQRFWRIIHEFCTAPIQAAHGWIAVKVSKSHWILKSMFWICYSMSRVFFFFFFTNTFIFKFYCAKPKTKQETKLANASYSNACKRSLSHHFCSCRGSKGVWKGSEINKVKRWQSIRLRLSGVWRSLWLAFRYIWLSLFDCNRITVLGVFQRGRGCSVCGWPFPRISGGR